MRIFSTCLLAGASLLALSTPARADEATPPADPKTVEATTDIIVVGSGETRQVQQLGQLDIAILAPGTSALKAIEKLPSVNFQSADAFGAYEWSQRVSIRSFNQNQIGFTLDGIPLGDGSYGNTNGLHISRAISSENIALTRVSQGAGSIGTQATNNLGGTIEFLSRTPAGEFGADVNGTYGSENTFRIFARIDTGELFAGGPSAYLSYGLLTLDKWKGAGEQRQHQVNAKVVQPIGDYRIVGTFNYSDRRENDYQDLSLGMINRLGYDWDNISDDFRLAVRIADIAANRGDSGATPLNPAAGTVYPAPFATVDDAYFDAAGLRRDTLASLGVESDADAPVKLTLRAYLHDNHGQGIWYTPYVPSPSGVPISVRTTEYDILRKGIFGSVGTKLAFNDLTLGLWYEHNDFRQARRFYGLDSRIQSSRDSLEYMTNPFFTQWEYDYTTKTFQYYVQDRIALGALTINLGWKGFEVRNTADPIVAGALASGEIKVTDWFQPHAGVAYALNDDAELFAGFTQVTRAFVSAATSGPFATTPAGFAALGSLKPEASDTYEIGGRFKARGLNLLAAAYYVDFRNRLIAQSTGAGIVGNPAILRNVGSVRSYGFETALEYRMANGLGAYLSYSYNDSTYRDNVVNALGVVTAATRGKTTVDAPKHLLKGEVSYDGDMFFGRVGANYLSKRYFTYENDQFVDGRMLFDATIGARFDIGGAKKLEVQLNAVNLFDKGYVATIGSNGFGVRGDNQTLLAGSPRQVFVTVKTGF